MTRSSRTPGDSSTHPLSGADLPRIAATPPGPASLALARRLRQVESRNVTYLSDSFPTFWSEARGANVRDVDGNVYLDLTGAFGVAAAGHAHPRITAAIAEQASRLTHGMGDVHPPERKVALLERLAELAPWPKARTVLASSGSEAVETALKTAHLATGRPGILALEGSYHGLTLGALATTSRLLFRGPFRERLFPGVRFVPFPGAAGAPRGSRALSSESVLEEVDRAIAELEEVGTPVGAAIVEVVQGRAGVRPLLRGFLAELAVRVRDVGGLVIVDEVFTGLGRTGELFAFEREGVLPDLLCLGKALGGGLPLSACMGPQAVMDAWPASGGEAIHTSTFLGHPLACASALAFLDVLQEEGLIARSRELGARLLGQLESELGGAPGVVEVRGRGPFVGVELSDEGRGVAVAQEALRRGLLVLPAGGDGRVVELSPPLTLTEEQVEAGVRLLGEAIRANPEAEG